MRLFDSLLSCLCIAAAALPVFGESNLTRGQIEILKVHKIMAEAAQKRDFAVWSKYVSEDCIFSDEEGELTTKEQIIENMRSMPRSYDRSENRRDFLVHLHGDTAVLNFRQTVHEQFTDTDIVSEMRHTETFVRRRGLWLLVAEQWGALPVNFRKPVETNTAAYKDYVGQYEWRPGGPIDTVSLRGGRLLARMTGESEDHEYRPLGLEAFFMKDDLGTVTFIRDAKGCVTGYTYRRADGQDIHVKKIK